MLMAERYSVHLNRLDLSLFHKDKSKWICETKYLNYQVMFDKET